MIENNLPLSFNLLTLLTGILLLEATVVITDCSDLVTTTLVSFLNTSCKNNNLMK